MAVLKLIPAGKDYLWGGTKLMTDFGKKYDGEKLAETWELSCHPDGPSRIENGPYAGKTLEEYIESCGRGILGSHCEQFENFPVLIKFIDAKGDLSIQVHPSDDYALKNEHQYGKTEMWYVVDCEEGASLYFGFSKEVDEAEFKERIENNTLTDVLNKVQVKKGDVFFIESGTIHAIGSGIVIAEIQQNSNVTYRVYDYGRLDKDGNPRELHVDKALKVTNTEPMTCQKSFAPHLGSCKYFTVDKLVMDGSHISKVFGTVDETSFLSLLILDGSGTIKTSDASVAFKKGDSLFMPAGTGDYEIEGTCDALVTTV